MKSLLSVAILIMVTLSSGMAVSADANLQARVWTDSDVYHPGDNINVWIAVNESCTAQLTFTKSNVPSTNFNHDVAHFREPCISQPPLPGNSGIGP